MGRLKVLQNPSELKIGLALARGLSSHRYEAGALSSVFKERAG